MFLKLFETKDSENVINKVLTVRHEIKIVLKHNVDLISPVLTLSDNGGFLNFSDCNYAHLSEFDRYYFVRTIENVNSNTWKLYLECDVLESFKDDIMNSEAELVRKIREGDYQSGNFRTQVLKEIDIYKSDRELESGSDMVLSTIGG